MPQFIAMAEHTLKILGYVDKVPSMACCEKCPMKFFTPRGRFLGDRMGTEKYREKFAQHQGPEPRSLMGKRDY
jgi:hypothetical protein